jgi:hypothetical protein
MTIDQRLGSQVNLPASLARCRICGRILVAHRLTGGRCRPGNLCAAAAMLREATAAGNEELAAGIERGMREMENDANS